MKDQDKVVTIPTCSQECFKDVGSFCPECEKWFCADHLSAHQKETGHTTPDTSIPWRS